MLNVKRIKRRECRERMRNQVGCMWFREWAGLVYIEKKRKKLKEKI